jgi:hypothetical protein
MTSATVKTRERRRPLTDEQALRLVNEPLDGEWFYLDVSRNEHGAWDITITVDGGYTVKAIAEEMRDYFHQIARGPCVMSQFSQSATQTYHALKRVEEDIAHAEEHLQSLREVQGYLRARLEVENLHAVERGGASRVTGGYPLGVYSRP